MKKNEVNTPIIEKAERNQPNSSSSSNNNKKIHKPTTMMLYKVNPRSKLKLRPLEKN